MICFIREKDTFTVECLESMDFDTIDYCLVERLLMYIGRDMQVILFKNHLHRCEKNSFISL
jgi:hypothetical protein